jgi:transcriptional regulator of acetoin/glycerol metabolism
MTDLRSVKIVHRDPAVRARLAAILESAGLQVTAAQPPAESLANGNGEIPAILDESQERSGGNGHAGAQGSSRELLEAAVRDEMTLRELSDLYTARILDRVNGNKVRAARILGINRRTLYRRGEARRRDAALRAAGELRERDH